MSAPQEATFSACRAAPTEGITTMPLSLSLAISSFFGASAKEATLTPCLMSRSTRSGASPASARRLTPKGLLVRCLTSPIAWSSSSKVIVAEARMPRPPAFAVAETSRGPATQPMPVWTTGWVTPVSSVSGVRRICGVTVSSSSQTFKFSPVSTNASRCSSAAPLRLSSKVKPCSKR